MSVKQKIIRVREGDSLPLDEYTETWKVADVVRREEYTDEAGGPWLYLLLERDEEASAMKQRAHENYLAAIDNLVRR